MAIWPLLVVGLMESVEVASCSFSRRTKNRIIVTTNRIAIMGINIFQNFPDVFDSDMTNSPLVRDYCSTAV